MLAYQLNTKNYANKILSLLSEIMKSPILSICMITYNHEQFILKAMEGILMQETDFEYEFIISNDHSTDKTHEIIQDFLKTQPKVANIHYFHHELNLGMMENFMFALKKCQGKYIALCEGDDYWIDTLKLQRQVDFLEKNPEYSMCFHNSEVININGIKVEKLFCNYNTSVFYGEDLLKRWLMPTASVVYRNIEDIDFPVYFNNSTHGDLALFLYAVQNKKIKYIDSVMSVYRLNSNSVTINKFNGIAHNEKHIEQCKQMLDYFKPKYLRLLKSRIASYLVSTAFLYSENKNGKMARRRLNEALTTDFLEFLKGSKYVLRTIINVLKF
ncbi:MAG: glycosyltransferase [Bacteroidota bacterium]